MTCCGDQKDFCVGAGATFAPIIRWGAKNLASAAITAISQSTPVIITAPSHGVVEGWPVAVVGVTGMVQMNASRYPPVAGDFDLAHVIDANTLSLNDVSSALYLAYVSGGAVVYNTPMSLAGVQATMTFWDAPTRNGTPLVTLTSGTGITIDPVALTVIPELQTAGLSWTTAYYNLDFTDSTGDITRILTGTLTLT